MPERRARLRVAVPVDRIDMRVDLQQARARDARSGPVAERRQAHISRLGQGPDQRRRDAVPGRHEDRQAAVAEHALRDARNPSRASPLHDGQIAVRPELGLLVGPGGAWLAWRVAMHEDRSARFLAQAFGERRLARLRDRREREARVERVGEPRAGGRVAACRRHRVVVAPPERGSRPRSRAPCRAVVDGGSSRSSARSRAGATGRAPRRCATLRAAPSSAIGCGRRGTAFASSAVDRFGERGSDRAHPPAAPARGRCAAGIRRAAAVRFRGPPRTAPESPARLSAGDRRRCCSPPG